MDSKNNIPTPNSNETKHDIETPFSYIATPDSDEKNNQASEHSNDKQNHTANFDPMTGERLHQSQPTKEYKRPKRTPPVTNFADESPTPSQQEPKTKKSHGTAKAVAGGTIGGLVASAALIAALIGGGVLKVSNTTSTRTQSINQKAISAASTDASTASAVASKCLPSVVSVSVSTQQGSGIGSGVVIDDKGNIITNWHVAGDADIITVKLGDKTAAATLVGGDESSDIAVINVNPNDIDLTPIEIGDSSALVVGDWVMTLGSPLGLDQSASSGIVSALYRNTLMNGTYGNTLYTNLIQVDAAINGGNSGGALVNSAGQLVGINTLYANGSGTESFSGIGFAIPGNYAIEIADKVIAGEKITHAYLGASCATIDEQTAKANRINAAWGAYVAEIAENSPAKQAGLQVGDVITKIGDMEITSADEYILAIRTHETGETVPIQVNRNGETITINVTLGSDEELQAQQQAQKNQQKDMIKQQQQQQQQYTQTWPWDSYEEMFRDFGF